MTPSTVIACVLCPKDAEGYYPEFEGDAARRAFAAHLQEVHGVAPGVRVERELSMHLSMARAYEAHYWLYETSAEGRGRRIGAQRVVTPRKGGVR